MIGNLLAPKYTRSLAYSQETVPKVDWEVALLFGVAGLLLGSYCYAATAPALKKINRLGDHGEEILPALLRLPPAFTIAGSSLVILATLVLLRNDFPR